MKCAREGSDHRKSIMRPSDVGGRGAECLQACATRSYLESGVLVSMAFLDKEITIPALAFSLLSAARRSSAL